MKPVATHHLGIEDFCTWRGLLVLSGIKAGAVADGHIFKANDNEEGLWFGEIDDLWKLGKPTGRGGPWKNNDVIAFSPSDPYLMTGYDKKTLTLSHDLTEPVEFIIELDFLADGSFHHYKTMEVPAGETMTYNFPEGFSAHWIRLLAGKDCKATAQLIYE